MKIVLLGPPGAGKGTQATFLTSRLRIPKISTGDMLRDAAERGDTVGMEAKCFTDQGLLVPDEIVIELVKGRLVQPDTAGGYLLDGFPRTVRQARALDRWLGGRAEQLDAAIDLEVRDDEIVRRISDRRVCRSCHESYHLTDRPPRVDELCDRCGKKLTQREDDRAAVVLERLRVYFERTRPVLEYYAERGLLHRVDGDRSAEVVTEDILAVLGEREAADAAS
jgi:adenylate kinase